MSINICILYRFLLFYLIHFYSIFFYIFTRKFLTPLLPIFFLSSSSFSDAEIISSDSESNCGTILVSLTLTKMNKADLGNRLI